MIAKQIKGTSFRGVLNYMEAKVKDGVGTLIHSNMLHSSARELSQEFGLIRSLKPNVSKAVYHCALSIHPDEVLTDSQFSKIGEEFLKEMNFNKSQYVIFRHNDQKHSHIHIIANRISMNGTVVSDKWDYKRAEEVVRKLEVKYGLQELITSDKVDEKALSKGQVEKFNRTGDIPIQTQLQLIIQDALLNSRKIDEFIASLAMNGVETQLHRNSTGTVFGVSFQLEGVSFKGSKLGRAYSWTKIQNQLQENYYAKYSREGKTGNTREERDLTNASQEASKSKRGEYSGAEERDKTNSYGNESSNGSSNKSSTRISTTNDSFRKDNEWGRSYNAGGDESFGTGSGSKETVEPEVDSSNGVYGDNNGSNNVFVPFTPSVKHRNEDDDDIRKGKKKKRGLSR